MEGNKLKAENKDLTKQINALQKVFCTSSIELFSLYIIKVMVEDKLVNNIIIDESLSIKAKHAIPRRTVILEEEAELSGIILI